jgi:hypothetical protein
MLSGYEVHQYSGKVINLVSFGSIHTTIHISSSKSPQQDNFSLGKIERYGKRQTMSSPTQAATRSHPQQRNFFRKNRGYQDKEKKIRSSKRKNGKETQS